MVAQPQGNLSLFPSPSSSEPPHLTRPQAPSAPRGQPSSGEPRGPRTQPVLRIRTTDDDSAQRPAFRPIEFDPPRRDQGRVDTSGHGHGDGDVGPAPSSEPQPALRSMFPMYNPSLPLDQQQYAPTQTSPAQFPRAVISRQSYYQEPPTSPEAVGRREPAPESRWPPARLPAREPSAMPRPSSTSQLRGLWKAANGWKARGSEGRVYCLSLSRLRDAPVYTCSSASSQPFYNLRLDPTSASAYVAMTRHDPGKPYKPPKPDAVSSSPSGSEHSGSRSSDTKGWHEALTTTLEEDSRRHPPHDGLVALLMPTPAAKMALERADDPVAVATAENECARLVWDDDAATHFLVHPALATPFRATIEGFPAYSRTEYTLEHHESPKHLAKLTRDGTGGGWIEIDTTVASMIDSYYIIDVVVAALILVASADDRNTPSPQETFEPPPLPPRAVLAGGTKRSSSRFGVPGMRRKDRKRSGRKVEEFEMDVESQDGSMGKSSGVKRAESKHAESKRPFVLRAMIKVAKGLFKCAMWVATILFKCVAGVFKLLYRCVGSKY
ncbi:acetylserotonin methytransferase-like protein [Hirsutella rhossiliensis]|uniref:Acetylserotonin methytransferase-like protein n=1 Tax=Hirsutella rhossiliensis TaxID=111463 RepID=A0A9P8MS40_9HYPO|nr:acetylserotonin methytransferase-like protein [Hirsutella rhossiliensis]KAH0959201.1 acetylserotonin methytransferase-like protein [Hirsutella rhossiliensis]